MSENLTVTVHKAKDLRIDETPIPEPKDDEVLIKMDSVGICGSDVHFWQDGGFGELIVKTPTAMGHEGAGIVHRYGNLIALIRNYLFYQIRILIDMIFNFKLTFKLQFLI